MKRALVLAGGGSKGSYEIGFLEALREMNIDFDIVTGTSIGALNACMIAQGNSLEEMESVWNSLDFDHVFASMPDIKNISEDFMNEKETAMDFFRAYIKNKGADVTPFYEIVRDILDEERLLSSNIDFGLCSVKYPHLKPLFITKKEMEKNLIYKYLLSSAACFPVFPMIEINGERYIDGGYYDNLPIDLAFNMGADEVIVVDMHDITKEAVHPSYLNRPHVLYTRPYNDLGNFMNFTPEVIQRNKRIGYLMGLKSLGRYEGHKYTFKKHKDDLFEIFYKGVLELERQKRTLINKEESSLTDTLRTSNYDQVLSLKDYAYITLDYLGTLIGLDELKVYSLHSFMNQIYDAFEEYRDPDYITGDLKDDVKNIIKDMNSKTFVGCLYHGMLYPEDDRVGMSRFMGVASKELLMAEMLLCMTKLRSQK